MRVRRLIWLIIALSLIITAYFVFFRGYTQVIENTDDSLEEKIGQMLIIGFRGAEVLPGSYIEKVIKDVKPGGVILFDYDVPSKNPVRNIINPEQTKKLISDLQNISEQGLFIGVDEEGGSVSRLKSKNGFPEFPGAKELGDKNDLSETEKISSELGYVLSELGFNLNFAPVVDVNINSESPAIGLLGRSFSADADKVASQALAFISGQRKQGIVTAIKHFPGHGSAKADSHLGFADVTETYREKELIPYQKIIGSGFTGMVMSAHIFNKNIDSKFPATMSPEYLLKILREQFGFSGVIISDDMQMGAIKNYYGFKEAVIRAVQAGCDILIISNNVTEYNERAPYEAYDAILAAVRDGIISKSRIDESYRRILELKKQYHISN